MFARTCRVDPLRKVWSGWLAAITLLLPCSALGVQSPRNDNDLAVSLRYRVETSPGSGRYHTLLRQEQLRPAETAIIVCDMWDYHHCLNAVRRVQEFAPRLNEVLKVARQQGVTIIHAPSECMKAYEDHPARKRAVATPPSPAYPEGIANWCHQIPEEEKVAYPIDQSDGGEDDDLEEHAQWAAKLTAMGRNPRAPWLAQTGLISIDPDRDYITDAGKEVWSILESRGIRNVILSGVHTNMCVLGRPFGLRQMALHGKNVMLMRDMTDTMYNPQRSPYVNHHTGTDLIVEYIEKVICPTLTSDQFLGGQPFRFSTDQRPVIAIVMAESEYRTNESLPQLAAQHLGRDFRIQLIFDDDQDPNRLPGLQQLDGADLLVLSVRRRVLEPEQMEIVRRFVAAGRPVIGIRTASHAFVLNNQPAPSGYVDWPEFDAQVWGGHYTGHYGNELRPKIELGRDASTNPLARGLPATPFIAGGSLYKTSPLNPAAVTILIGQIEGQPPEPVAWTFVRSDGGRSFYTSLGHPDDFQNPAFVTLLRNGIYELAGLPIPEQDSELTLKK